MDMFSHKVILTTLQHLIVALQSGTHVGAKGQQEDESCAVFGRLRRE